MAKIAKDKTDISTLTQQLITLSIPAIFLQALGPDLVVVVVQSNYEIPQSNCNRMHVSINLLF